MRDEIVDDIERFVFSVAIDVTLAVLDDEQCGRSFWIVLRGDVNPIFAFHAIVDLAGVSDLVGEFPDGHVGMLVGIGRVDGDIVAAAEFFVRDEIVESVRGAEAFDAGRRIPEFGVSDLAHFGAAGVVDEERGFCVGFGGEEKFGALADEGFAGLEILDIEGGGDGVTELRTVGFGEFDQLRRGGFFGGHGVGRGGGEDGCQ